MRRPRPDEKPSPKWLGRTIFASVGVLFLLSGLSDLGITNRPTVATELFSIFLGVVAIASNLLRRPNENSNWLARTFFVVLGVVFVASGIWGLLQH
jgi:hypothetical protein